MNRPLATLAAATALTLTVSGCMVQGGTNADGNSRLRVALNFTPRADLSPYTDDAVSLTRLGIIEPLITFDKDGTPQPGLAEKFTMEDASTATFTLRKGLTFHDGSKVDAKAAAASLNHALTATPAPATVSGRALTITAEGEDTVKVVSETPDPILMQRFGNPDMSILAAKAYEKNPSKPDTLGAGTGPFVLKEVTGNTAVKADANPSYWGGKPRLTGLDVKFISKADSRVAGLRAGELDVIQNVPIAQVGNIKDQVVDTRPVPRTTGISLNTRSGPLADPAMRAAFAKAIDGKAVATSVFEGQAHPAVGYFRGDTVWTKDRPAPQFPAPADPKGTSLTLATYDDRPELPEALTLVADQLRKAGFTVDTPVVKAYNVLEPEIMAGKYDAVIGSRMYMSKANDPISVLQSDFGCKGSYNLSFHCNETLDKELTEAAGITDVTQRRTRAAAIESTVLGAGAYVPLVHEVVRIGRTKKVDGLNADPLEWTWITHRTTLAG
ncbi:peptide/nickel transport system substrate-binding protein [Austwickia chelonae]|uniref:Putative ABC transporter substrate-binding protein n=1 Tax=Austwickia chelonae NBRC 105200 TaxID=1184607 RepID=K6VAW9_9MICO|nr:ABC transporter substrate-binding protein [Austwickia chelonae]GAB79393.1 putative ABC transporter substrate-binding protein [Austwickia chelonae NBRC 105200]SEW43591.1 peptide/nickel transport system substrate-binding protein [Austwickia chelonae]